MSMDSGKDGSASLPLAGIGSAAEWLWRAADLKNLRATFGSSGEFAQTGAEKEIAAQAVAFVVNSSRKGIVSLCADVANLLRTRRSLEEKLMAREGDVISPTSGEPTGAPYGSWTIRSNSSSSSSAAAAAAPAAAFTTAVGCSPSCKHHRISRASSSNSGGSGSATGGCCCHSGCCAKDIATMEGGNAGATKDTVRDDCHVVQCRHGNDRPPLCRQASLELNSDGSIGCNRIDSRDALTRCDVTLSESADKSRDAPCPPDCLADESRTTELHSPSGDVLQSSGRCDGDGQPADMTCGSGTDCCCCLLERGPRLADGGAVRGLSCNSCCTSEDEAIPNSSSSSRRKSRGVQVNLPIPHALNSVTTRCSSCRACEDRLSDALQANRKLLTQLAATQRELICVQEKLCRYSNGTRNQARVSSPNGSSMPADSSMPVGKTSPTYSPPATTEPNRSVSHSRSTSQMSDDAVQPAAITHNPSDCSPKAACSPTGEHRNGRLLPSPKSTAGGRRTVLSESSTAGSADSGTSAGTAGSADSRSTAVAAASRASAASGALGKLRRLIKGASVGGTIVLAEPRKTVKLGDEVVTTFDQRGVVRYIGTLRDAANESPTIYAGLQLYEPVGTSDGTYEGRRFFSCEQNHGLFVALNDIKSVVKKKQKLAINHRRGGSSDAGSSRSEDLSTAAGVLRSAALPQNRSDTTATLSAGNSPRSASVNYERRATLPTLHNWSSSLSSQRRSSDAENVSTV